MRKIFFSLVMLLVLAGSNAFASQNKNTSRGKGSGIAAHHDRGHRKGRHHRQHHRKQARARHNKNM